MIDDRLALGALAQQAAAASIVGTEDADTLRGTEGDDAISGLGGDDVLYGLAGTDTLNGGAGNDTLDGGIGADQMSGGEGDDTYYLDNGGDSVIELAGQGSDTVITNIVWTMAANVERAILTATNGSLYVVGNDLDNFIQTQSAGALLRGEGGNDELRGSAFNDRLDGGTGDDRMYGGAGSDIYTVDSAGDQIFEDAVAGFDQVYSSVDWTLGANVENLTLEGSAHLTGNGNAGNNEIRGNTGNNLLTGGEGNDKLYGEAGDDQIYGDGGDDTIDGGAGINSLYGGAGNDLLISGFSGASTMAGGTGDDRYEVNSAGDTVVEAAGEGNDLVTVRTTYTLPDYVENLTIGFGAVADGTGNGLANILTGNGNSNFLMGMGGDDTLIGMGGNDVFDGGTGADKMTGGLGNDRYYVDNVGDVVSDGNGGGIDTVYSSVSFQIGAGIENLTLLGSESNAATGNSLANIIVANVGDNVVTGGGGADDLTGGGGADRFVYTALSDSTNAARDVIRDFVSGLDKIDLSLLGQVSVAWTTQGSGTSTESIVTVTGTGSRTMVVDVLGAVAMSDFIFSGPNGGGINQTLTGTPNDDVFNGKEGDDTIDGGAGHDTALYAVSLFRTGSIETQGDVTTVFTRDEGIDAVTRVEAFQFRDGVYRIDAEATYMQVTRLYDTVLQRAPDEQGLTFYVDRIDRQGGSLLGVANDLLGSAEFQSATGNLNNGQFVDYVYAHALGRAADADGRAYYLNALDHGLSRGALLIDFSESAEHRSLTADQIVPGHFSTDPSYEGVALLFDSAFGRLPDEDGLVFYGERVKTGTQTLLDVANDFANAGEFRNATYYLNHGQLVDYMYQNTLGRAPDADGRAYYVNALDNGMSVGALLDQFAQSAEHRSLFASHITGGIDII